MSLGFSPLAGDALSDTGDSPVSLAYIASGIESTTAIGTPAAVVPDIYAATGIGATVVFGTPSASAAASVAGFSSTQVGTPAAVLAGTYIVAGIAPTAAVGTPSTPTAASTVTGVQSAYARTTLVGKPIRMVYNYAASAAQGSRVGNPKAVTTRYTCIVSGIYPATAIGLTSSLSVLRAKAESISASQIGTPIARFTQFGYVSGFKSTRFGQPRVPLAPFDLSLHVVKRERRLYAGVS